jgi:peptidoglycan/xylan/chitin deacetylase (PgdA/CDA1 family)
MPLTRSSSPARSPVARLLGVAVVATVCLAGALAPAGAAAAPAKPPAKPKVYPGDAAATTCPAPKVMSRRDVVYGQDPVRKLVAITFDDGPHPTWTPRVLDTLKRYKVKATFFVNGLNAERYPGLVARMRREGHTVANHTWNHTAVTSLSAAALRNDVLRTSSSIKRRSGQKVVCYFRPPYGRHNAVSDARVKALGLSVVLWTVDTGDWKRPGSAAIRARAAKARSGDIVLLHDGGGDRSQTVAALPGMLQDFSRRGIRLVGVNGR